jgi:hypothetical protein
VEGPSQHSRQGRNVGLAGWTDIDGHHCRLVTQVKDNLALRPLPQPGGLLGVDP